MRSSGTKGYQGYRGRGGGSGRKLLAAALVVLLLVAGGLLFAQRYVVYEADGSLRFDWPWSRRTQQPQEPQQSASPPAQGLEIVIRPPAEPDPPPVEEDPEPHARELNASVLQGGVENALLALPEGTNALAVRVKNSTGELLYNSQLTGAIEAQAAVGSSIARASIEALTASDYYVIARIAALHDSLYSFAHMTDAAVQQLQYRGYIWYAPDSTFYLAPEKPLARQYLVDIAVECAELGFDELLFDEFTYPAWGRLDNIKTDERTVTMTEALTQLAVELREAMEPYGVRVSVVMDAETVRYGSNLYSGQSVEAFAQVFDRIYVPVTAEQTAEIAAVLAAYPAEFVPITAQPPAAGPYLIAP